MSYGMSSPTKQKYNDKVPSGYEAGTLQQFTPEQLQLFQQMFSHVGPDSMTSKLASGDQSAFAEMEAPALRQFNELQGGLASRFSGMGGTGAQKSSGFQNTMNAAQSNFAQDLQGKRMDLQRQALQDLMSMSHSLMGERPYERDLFEKQNKSSGFGGLIGAGLGGLGGFFAGGPGGAMAGAKLGHSIGSSF